MFEWLPEVCRELRGNLVEIYWLLLIPYTVFLICLEFFRISDGSGGGGGRILRRVVISMLLLFSFEECMNLIALLSDGITEKINGLAQLKDLLHKIKENYNQEEINWLRVKEAILYIVSLISYIVAYLGVFVADVLIHFVWSVLYVVSPLMILMYVSDKTAFVTGSLYKGLFSVVTWKILWSVLAVMLLKLATHPEVSDSDNFIVSVLMNLCIGISMLFIPIATKSLLHDGLGSAASAIAAVPAAATYGAVKTYAKKFGTKGVNVVTSPFRGNRNHARHGQRRSKKNE